MKNAAIKKPLLTSSETRVLSIYDRLEKGLRYKTPILEKMILNLGT
nr:hypothetical protein 1 [Piscirickettsiaceae bacterium]